MYTHLECWACFFQYEPLDEAQLLRWKYLGQCCERENSLTSGLISIDLPRTPQFSAHEKGPSSRPTTTWAGLPVTPPPPPRLINGHGETCPDTLQPRVSPGVHTGPTLCSDGKRCQPLTAARPPTDKDLLSSEARLKHTDAHIDFWEGGGGHRKKKKKKRHIFWRKLIPEAAEIWSAYLGGG